ncbi:MAG TPA: response regulator [Gammaproteobacteria bacterium]|nr:response regulator [Gammaproteobacteria bacterium]
MSPPDRDRPLVLIIDDSPTEQIVFVRWLKAAGYDVATADDGTSGVEKARLERPDAILLDIVMPGMSGFQVARQLRKDPATSTVGIVVVTTKREDSERYWAMKQGADRYLTKPVAEADLLAALAEVLAARAAPPTG